MNQNRKLCFDTWTEQQDKALLYLKEDLQMTRWQDIARKLHDMFNIPGKNHKQCKQRYMNFLKSSPKRTNWTKEDEEKLIKLYIQYGNKWSQVARHIKDTNGGIIKNKFYSRLRKGIRNLNCLIEVYYPKVWKKLQFDVIFKIINTAANKFDFSSRSAIGKKVEAKITFLEEIVEKLFQISWIKQNGETKKKTTQEQRKSNRMFVQNLIEQINFIDQNVEKKRSNRILAKKKQSKQRKNNYNSQKKDHTQEIGQVKIEEDFQFGILENSFSEKEKQFQSSSMKLYQKRKEQNCGNQKIQQYGNIILQKQIKLNSISNKIKGHILKNGNQEILRPSNRNPKKIQIISIYPTYSSQVNYWNEYQYSSNQQLQHVQNKKQILYQLGQKQKFSIKEKSSIQNLKESSQDKKEINNLNGYNYFDMGIKQQYFRNQDRIVSTYREIKQLGR